MIRELTKRINEKKLSKEDAISLLDRVVVHPRVLKAIEDSSKKISGGRIPYGRKSFYLKGGRIPRRIIKTITITEIVEMA